MMAGSSNLQSPFHVFLSSDIREIDVVSVCFFPEKAVNINLYRFKLPQSVEKIKDIPELFHPVNIQSRDHRRLPGIFHRHYYPLEAFFPCTEGYWKNTFHGLKRPVEGKFTHHDVGFDFSRCYLFIGRQDSHCQGKVVRRSLLPDIGRGHVYKHLLTWPPEAQASERRLYPLLALFHCHIGKTDKKKAYPPGYIDFNSHRNCINACYGTGECPYQHNIILARLAKHGIKYNKKM